jgi:SAM-dependent methyltransferase
MSVVEPADRTPPTDPLRAALHAMWSSVAGAWGDHAPFVDARGTPVATAMLDLCSPARGDRVLELACGPAGVGLLAAERVGPDGRVVVSDVAPEMVEVAAARAEHLGLTDVVARVLDLEHVDEPARSFDVVLCRDALMLVPDPVLAATEIRRVLRPGGRAALAVWGPRERNPWLGVLFDAVSAHTGAPVPPPGLPGPFSLDSVEGLADVLRRAGLDAVEIHEVDTPLTCGSFDEWWRIVPALAGPLAQVVAALPAEDARAIRAHAAEGLAPYAAPGGYRIPGLNLVAGARRRDAVPSTPAR